MVAVRERSAEPIDTACHGVLGTPADGYRRALWEQHPHIDPSIVDAIFDEALSDLAAGATVQTYLPLLAARRARERLELHSLSAATR